MEQSSVCQCVCVCVPFLDHYLQKREGGSLSANLRSENDEPDFLYGQKSAAIFEVEGVRIGVVGLLTR